jgi:hypothetical protein
VFQILTDLKYSINGTDGTETLACSLTAEPGNSLHKMQAYVSVYLISEVTQLIVIKLCNMALSILGGVVVSVLVTGPKDCGFEPGQGEGFLRAIKIRRTRSSRMGSKAGRSRVVRFYDM